MDCRAKFKCKNSHAAAQRRKDYAVNVAPPRRRVKQIVTPKGSVLESSAMFNPQHYRPLESRANLFAD